MNVVVSFALALWLSLRAGTSASAAVSASPQTLLARAGLRRWRRELFRTGAVSRTSRVPAVAVDAAPQPSVPQS